MPKSICVLITKMPFGSIHASEALRLVSGATSYRLDVSVILTGDGVFAAMADQRAEEAGWTSLAPLLSKYAAQRGARIYADAASLRARGIGEQNVITGVSILPEEALFNVIANSQVMVVF